MDLGLSGKVALVTAASRGLGRACALTLAEEGVRVAVAARDADALATLAKEIEAAGSEALVLPGDIGDPSAPEALVDQVTERWGRLDALVVSTPGPPSMRCADVTDEIWHDAMDMNCLVPMRLTRAALPAMRRAGGGRIVYIGTIGVRVAQPDMVLSNATRLALMGYAKTLSLEVAADNILVNMVAPGPLATERMDELAQQTAERLGITEEEAMTRWLDEVPLGRMGTAGDLSSLVALLVSDACSYISGAVVPVDGGKASAY
jgi:3-oxoacyl-[acyl-carrier protein] reductase